MTPVLVLLVGVLLVLLITLATAYFVAQEFAYMAVDRAALAARADDGDTGARRALDVTRRTSFMLSGAQLGITVTGLLVGYVAEPLIGQSLGGLLGVALPTGVSVAIGAVVAISLSTVIQMVLGELLPKNYAIARPEPVAVALAASTRVYLLVLGPLIRVFDVAAEALLRVLGIEPVHDVDQAADPTDLRQVVRDSRESGELSPRLSVLLDRILDFPDRAVSHALVPRTRVDVLELDRDDVATARARMGAGHTRYPVVDADDRIRGVVDMLDVLPAHVADGSPVADVMRPALVLSEHGGLPDALSRLLYDGQQLACVVDEFGTFIGILTLEDLAEEIVGEIHDEHDEPEVGVIEAAGDGAWLVHGDAPLDEVERALEVALPRGDFETVSGLLSALAGTLPEVGSQVTVPLGDAGQALEAEVLQVRHFVPARVRLRVRPAEPPDQDPRDAEEVAS